MSVFDLLHLRLREAIRSEGYEEPTPVQERAIPVILRGEHTLLVAPTGTGKTEAALFPIYSMILEKGLQRGRGVVLLYITPLRALNRDILRRMRVIAEKIGLSVAVRHGDTPRRERRRIAKEPPHMLITTPETLQFLLVIDSTRRALKRVRWVVVDELHELLYDKRGAQLTIALERLSALIGRSPQRIGLSATIGDVETAKRVLGGWRRVVDVVVRHPRPMMISVDLPVPDERDKELSEELSLSPEVVARLRRIVDLVSSSKRCLVFTNTRDMAELLGSRLKLISSLSVEVHHGSLSRAQRLTVESSLKHGLLRGVICTSSLELGIDIGDADLVVQYMSPRQAVKLVQRVGRSGHRLDKAPRGVVIAGVSVDDLMESLVLARRAMHEDLEIDRPHFKALDVLAHQIAGIVLEHRGGISLGEVYELVTRSYLYKDLSPEELREVVYQLASQGIVRVRDDRVSVGRGVWKYYYTTSMIPNTRSYTVKDVISGKDVGSLDERFVMTRCREGFKFILAGKAWEVISVEGDHVVVQPAGDPIGAIPAWEGELIPVDYKVAREVAALRRRLACARSAEEMRRILESYPATPRALNKIIEFFTSLPKDRPVPDDRTIVVESLGKTLIVHAPLGSKGAKALEVLLASVLSARLGVVLRSKSDPYRVILLSPRPIPAKLVADILYSLGPEEAVREVKEALRNSAIYRWRLLQVAKRFGAIAQDAPAHTVMRVLDALTNTVIGVEALREVLTEDVDLDVLIRILTMIRAGRLKVVVDVREDGKPSPFAFDALIGLTVYDQIASSVPLDAMIRLLKQRLLTKRVSLVCLKCGNWMEVDELRRLPDRVRCDRCGSGFIAVARPEDRELVRRYISGAKLRGEERKRVNELRRSADLVLVFGRPAVIALSAYGIGPSRAAKIMGKLLEGEREFYKAIFLAEREYVRTRRFWDR